MKVGEAIVHYRKQKIISQKGLAEMLGVTTGYLSNVESNKREPSLSFIRIAAAHLKIKPSDIVFYKCPVPGGFYKPIIDETFQRAKNWFDKVISE